MASLASVTSSMEALERFNRDVKAHETKLEELHFEFLNSCRTEFEAIRIQYEANLKDYESEKNELDKAHKSFSDHFAHYCTQLNEFYEINEYQLLNSRYMMMMDACKDFYELHRQIIQDYQSRFNEYEKSFLRVKSVFGDTVEHLNKRSWPPSNQVNVDVQVDPDQINAGIQVYPEDLL